MKYSKFVGIAGVILMYISAWLPWVEIVSSNIVVTGLHSEGTNFGKPALMNLIVSGVSFVLFLWPSVMAKRFNLFFCAFNVAWAIRNFIVLTACRLGDCPEKRIGLFVMSIAALMMVGASFTPDIDVADKEEPVIREDAPSENTNQ